MSRGQLYISAEEAADSKAAKKIVKARIGPRARITSCTPNRSRGGWTYCYEVVDGEAPVSVVADVHVLAFDDIQFAASNPKVKVTSGTVNFVCPKGLARRECSTCGKYSPCMKKAWEMAMSAALNPAE